MSKQIIVKNKEELASYRQCIESNLETGIEVIRKLLEHSKGIDLYQHFKFYKLVPEPLTGEPENLIEVINQSQTYLVSIKAAEYLFDHHPEQKFLINFGNVPGYDIESLDGTIIAECFAATSYSSNRKLVKDLDRLSQNKTAEYKYEFFHDKEFGEKQKTYYGEKYRGIQIIKFSEH